VKRNIAEGIPDDINENLGVGCMDGRLDFIILGVTNSFEMLGVPVKPNVNEESSDGDTDIEEALGCLDEKSDESIVGISDSFEILGVPVK